MKCMRIQCYTTYYAILQCYPILCGFGFSVSGLLWLVRPAWKGRCARHSIITIKQLGLLGSAIKPQQQTKRPRDLNRFLECVAGCWHTGLSGLVLTLTVNFRRSSHYWTSEVVSRAFSCTNQRILFIHFMAVVCCILCPHQH